MQYDEIDICLRASLASLLNCVSQSINVSWVEARIMIARRSPSSLADIKALHQLMHQTQLERISIFQHVNLLTLWRILYNVDATPSKRCESYFCSWWLVGCPLTLLQTRSLAKRSCMLVANKRQKEKYRYVSSVCLWALMTVSPSPSLSPTAATRARKSYKFPQ